MGILSLSGLLSRSSFLLGPNLKLDVPSYISFKGFSGRGWFLKRSSKSSPLGVCDSVLGVPRGLINLLVSGGFQGFSSLFNPKAFIPSVVSGILKVFQEDILLSDVLLSISCFSGSGVLCWN